MKSELELQKEFIEKPELQEQIKYLKSDAAKGLGGIVQVDAFLKSIRDLGYKSTPYALNELNDNSIQAGARNIHYEILGVKNKVKELLVMDDGHGMPKDMLRIAVTWGGTHRQGSKRGFGKYGFGLPSASLSIAKKYTIYSKIDGEDWNKITFDITRLDDDDNSVHTDLKDIMKDPERCPNLPKFIADFEGKNYSVKKLKQGTIIHFEEIDRIKPASIDNLMHSLIDDFSQTYFKLLESTNFFVNDKKVVPVDTCFVTPGLKGYEDPMNNLKVPQDYYDEKTAEVKMRDGSTHDIHIRWSRLPALFAVENGKRVKKVTKNVIKDITTHEFVPSKESDIEQAYIKGLTDKISDKKSFRYKVMNRNHGIVFRRLGRRMDVVKNFKGKFNIGSNSRYWGCEVNFPPALDEYFSVNTSKQQILPEDAIIDTLEKSGIFKYLNQIEDLYYKENTILKDKRKESEKENPNQTKDSETIAEEAAKLLGETTATTDHQERVKKRNARKEEKIKEIAEKLKISIKDAEKKYEDVYKDRPMVFSEESFGKNKPFIFFDEHQDTVEVTLNTDHDFYKAFYMGPGTSDQSRTSWQTFFLMFAQLTFTYSEDHRDFLQGFVNKLNDHLKAAGRKRYDKLKEEPVKEDDDDDDDIHDELQKLDEVIP